MPSKKRRRRRSNEKKRRRRLKRPPLRFCIRRRDSHPWPVPLAAEDHEKAGVFERRQRARATRSGGA